MDRRRVPRGWRVSRSLLMAPPHQDPRAPPAPATGRGGSTRTTSSWRGEVVERAAVTRAAACSPRGAERCSCSCPPLPAPNRRFAEPPFFFFSRSPCASAAIRSSAPPCERGGDARLTLRLRAQREQRARGSVCLLPGNLAVVVGEEENSTPSAAAPRASAWRRRRRRARRTLPNGAGAFASLTSSDASMRILHRRYLGERLVEAHACVRDDQPAWFAHQSGIARGGRVERDAIDTAEIRQRVVVESRARSSRRLPASPRASPPPPRAPASPPSAARSRAEELRERLAGKLEPPRRERVRRRGARGAERRRRRAPESSSSSPARTRLAARRPPPDA